MQCRHRRERVETSGIRNGSKHKQGFITQQSHTQLHMTQSSLNYQRKISDKDKGGSLLCNEPLFFPLRVLSYSLHFRDVHFSTCTMNRKPRQHRHRVGCACGMERVQPTVWPGALKRPQTEDPQVNLPISPCKKKTLFSLISLLEQTRTSR